MFGNVVFSRVFSYRGVGTEGDKRGSKGVNDPRSKAGFWNRCHHPRRASCPIPGKPPAPAGLAVSTAHENAPASMPGRECGEENGPPDMPAGGPPHWPAEDAANAGRNTIKGGTGAVPRRAMGKCEKFSYLAGHGTRGKSDKLSNLLRWANVTNCYLRRGTLGRSSTARSRPEPCGNALGHRSENRPRTRHGVALQWPRRYPSTVNA